MMIISVSDKNLQKLVSSVENLITLKMQERVKPAVFAKIIDFYINSNLPHQDLVFYRKKIFELFEKHTQLDGLTPGIWDLYSLFLEKVELVINKSLDAASTEQICKDVVEIRLKQIRNYLINDWEKNSSNFPSILLVSTEIEKTLLKLEGCQSYNQQAVEVKEFLGGIKQKINEFQLS